MHCTKCDAANPADSRFCNTCGAALSLSPDSPATQQTVQLTPTVTPSAPMTPATANPMVAPAATLPAAMAATAPAAPIAPVNVNVTVQAPVVAAAAPPPVIVVAQNAVSGPGCLVRSLYFLFVGLWLGLFWTTFAWLALVSVIGLPIGLMMLNRLPQVMTLKPVRKETQVTVNGNVVTVGQTAVQQRSFMLRTLYFVLIGFWLSGLWLGTAWGLIAVTGGLALPISFWMFDRTPAIVTLARQ